ncbi:MAG: metal-dependent transcriptional regulator [Gemmataceae bacterium]|nr:metal-dependent transcriptional regulator [Gemmataceae bacterium]MDW8242665.1 metal-dependent transcriptional regulator [Thermogemmata sp.]
MPDQPQLTKAIQDYLKTIHRLGGAQKRVTPTAIAQALKVKGPSVTGMLKRLAEGGWIEYQPSRGAQLTRAGIRAARRVIRRHRLVELFLTQVLGLDWSEVDAEAEALEHAISPRLERALADYLGEPLEDPHGHPIPSSTGSLRRRRLKPLSAFRVGQTIIIREVQDDNPARLRHWQQLGLVPGAVVRLIGYHELEDVFELEVGERRLRLGRLPLAGLFGQSYTRSHTSAPPYSAPQPPSSPDSTTP